MTPEFEGGHTEYPKMEYILKFKNSIRVVFRKLQIKTIPTPTIDDLDFCSFSPHTKPGFRYENYFYFDTKLKAVNTAFKLAKVKYKYIEKCCSENKNILRRKLFPSLFNLGARNKVELETKDDSVLLSRAIHAPEFHNDICSSNFIEEITDQIVESKRKGPIKIGHSFINFKEIVKDSEGAESVLEGDYRRFDSTIYLSMILMGVAVMRCFYPLKCKRADYHFISIFDELAIKDYYSPGGNIFRIFHGLPSGHKSTSILGSIINLISLSYIFKKEDLKKVNFAVGGDDFLIFMKYKLKTKIEVFENRAKDIGMEFKFLVEKSYLAKNVNDMPVFYKYTIKNGEPIIPLNVIVHRVLLPWNKNYNSDIKVFDFLNDLMPSLASPTSSCLIYYEFYAFMYKRLTGNELSLLHIHEQHKNIYSRIMDRKMPLIKASKEEKWKVNIGSLLSSFNHKNDEKCKISIKTLKKIF